jgi:uncharacterized protein (DUF952 family)
MSSPGGSPIFHITSEAAWAEAQRAGAYRAASLESEGFIHCSSEAQLRPVAEAFYAGQSGLVVLQIDPARLTARLVWEAPVAPSGAADAAAPAAGPFPHVYGPIDLAAVTAVTPLAAILT